MTTELKIDFVSDVSCPWCAIGLSALETAIARAGDAVTATVHCQPFELNPGMGAEGQDITEHLTEKYGSTAVQQSQIRESIRQRGAEVGFTFSPVGRGRIWNTFDAHRLLHWAGVEGGQGPQLALKKALLQAYHGRAESPAAHDVLLRAVQDVGLDVPRAREVLQSDAYAPEVREREQFFTGAGIQSVPAAIINDRFLISGGQPVEVFEQALRQIAAGKA